MSEDKKNKDDKERKDSEKNKSAEKKKKAVKSGAVENRSQHKKQLKKHVTQRVAKDQLEGVKAAVPEEVPPTAPVNPFEQAQVEVNPLPNSAKDSFNEDKMESSDEDFDVNEPQPQEVAPMNPFEMTNGNQADSSLESKPLNEKPLDRKFNAVADNPFESSSKEDQVKTVEIQDQKDEKLDEPVVVDAKVTEEKDPVESSEVEVVDIADQDIQPEVNEVQANLAQDSEEFSEEFWDILEQAGITKRKLGVFLIILFVVVVLVFGVFFGWFSFFSFDSDRDEEIELSEDLGNDINLQNDQDLQQTSFPVISSYIFGLEHSELVGGLVTIPVTGFSTESSIDSNLIFGLDEPLARDDFAEYVSVLDDLRNIYNTDIYNYLDKSADRVARLDELIDNMANLNDEALIIFNQLGNDLNVLEINFEAASAERDLYEQEFFRLLSLFEGNKSLKEFDNFLILEERVLTLKARFGAYAALREMYGNALELTIPRLQDIRANRAALIEGIRVFDVPGSDINAILPLPFEFPE